MKVIQLNLSDYHLNGGTGIAMHRLHLGLRKAGIDSQILCRLKTLGTSQNIATIPRSISLKIAEKLLKEVVTSQIGLNDIHIINSFNIKKATLLRRRCS